MRVSAVCYAAASIEEVKELSYKVTSVTHNHIEGIKGAEATAVAIYMALQGSSIQEIKDYCKKELDSMWDEMKRFENPQTYYVDLSQKMWDMKHELLKGQGKITK